AGVGSAGAPPHDDATRPAALHVDAHQRSGGVADAGVGDADLERRPEVAHPPGWGAAAEGVRGVPAEVGADAADRVLDRPHEPAAVVAAWPGAAPDVGLAVLGARELRGALQPLAGALQACPPGGP